MSVAHDTIAITKKGKTKMKRYADFTDFSRMPLAQIEKTLDAYLKIAEDSDWDITQDFERELSMLTMLAKQKGSVRKW